MVDEPILRNWLAIKLPCIELPLPLSTEITVAPASWAAVRYPSPVPGVQDDALSW